jgi:hypothetical protein
VAILGLLMLPVAAFAKDLCKKSNTQHLCEGNWGIPRSEMPQVTGDVRAHFLARMGTQTRVTRERIPTEHLTPIQSEINQNIVVDMLKAHHQGRFSPCDTEILVAKSWNRNYIVDGHHTATACRLLGGSQLAIVVRDFGRTILQKLRDFPGVFHLNMNDAQKV